MRKKVKQESIFNSEVGGWIRKLRYDSRMGPEEVAQELALSVGDIEKWEAGGSITLAELMQLLRFYKVDPQLVGAKLGQLYVKFSLKKNVDP